MKIRNFAILLCSLLIIIPTSSFALLVTGSNSINGTTSFEAEISYEVIDRHEAKLTIDIKNTTVGAEEYIVAFAFNNPQHNIKAVEKGDPWGDGDFNVIGGNFKGGIDTTVFGLFDIGASAGADFLAVDADPLSGIASGNSAIFEFWFTDGSNLSGFTEQDFADALSEAYDETRGEPFLAVRFKGSVENSDITINGEGKTAPVPEPATMLLLGAGLIGLAGLGRKKMKKKS